MQEKKVTTELITEWNNNILKYIKESFEEHGSIPFIIHALASDGENIVIPVLDIGPVNERDWILEAFISLTAQKNIVAVVFCSEVWFTSRPIIEGLAPSYKNYGLPSEQPDKMEALFISFEIKDEIKQKIFIIKREGATTHLEPFREGVEPIAMGGRFTKFLRKI